MHSVARVLVPQQRSAVLAETCRFPLRSQGVCEARAVQKCVCPIVTLHQ